MKKNMYAPDGFNKDGSARPWRAVEVIRTAGAMVKIKYLDSNEETFAPSRALSETKRV